MAETSFQTLSGAKRGSILQATVLRVCSRLSTSVLACTPGHAPWTPGSCVATWALAGSSTPGSRPWLYRRAWSLPCCTCYALSSDDLDTESRTSPTLCPSCRHNPSSARRPPVFASVQFPPMDPESTLTLGTPFSSLTHSCLSRLFSTVPHHHST